MQNEAPILVMGDVHGQLQLALSLAHLWQEELGTKFGAILLCGDVGTFTREEELDSATRSHARKNSMELEFLHQWAVSPQPPWIEAIFRPVEEGGLGIEAPIIMVHGNHEGFEHLTAINPDTLPDSPVGVGDLPTVDSGHRIRYLPSGWAVRLRDGTVVGGVGGIEMGARDKNYHEMAWIDENAVDNVLLIAENHPLDVLITHQGPGEAQERTGASVLNRLLKRGVARYWFHGHGMDDPSVREIKGITVVPLSSVSLSGGGQYPDEISTAVILPGGKLVRGLPKRYRLLSRNRWRKHVYMGREVFVSPLLEHHAFRYRVG